MVVYERESRHYFVQLRLHSRWRKFLALPHFRLGAGEMLPVSDACTLGFSPFAAWAHAVAEVAAGIAAFSVVLAGAVRPVYFRMFVLDHSRCAAARAHSS